MSLVKASNIQIGQDVSATNNFVLSAPANGTLAIGVGNSGSQTTILTIASGGTLSLTGNATLGSSTANSHTINGSTAVSNQLSVGGVYNANHQLGVFQGSRAYGLEILAATSGVNSGNAAIRLLNAANTQEHGMLIGGPTAVRLSAGTSGDLRTLGIATGGADRLQINPQGDFSRVIPGGSTLYPDFACRAWVNFNGTNGVLNAGGNLTAVRTAVGVYTMTFASAMPDSNYNVVGSALASATNSALRVGLNGTTKNTTTFTINVNNASTGVDSTDVSVSVTR